MPNEAIKQGENVVAVLKKDGETKKIITSGKNPNWLKRLTQR